MKNAKKWLWALAALTVTVICAAGLLRNSGRSSQRVDSTSVAMGAVITQTLYSADESLARKTASEASAAVSALEQAISWRIESSEIARMNAGETVALSQPVQELLEQCSRVSETSGGAFDCTILSVSRLWEFEAEEFLPPTAETVAEALRWCGDRAQNQNTVPDPSIGAGIDLGAVGKGTGCDVAVDVYREAGISAGIVSVGGSIGVFGEKPDGSAWTIGIRDPNGDSTETLGTISVTEGFVSTSGTYEKQREFDGVQYHHLLDPKTGFPAKTDLVSATVFCSSGALSDALATAAVVLGEESAPAFLNSWNVEYLLVTANGELIASNRVRSELVLTSSAYAFEEEQP